MKRPRYIAVVIALLLVALLAARLAYTSQRQNAQVRAHFTRLFNALQDQDKKALVDLYYPVELTPAVYDQFFAYPLLGWKITEVSGQPWPMDDTGGYHTLTATLYYKAPTTGLPAAMKATYRQTTHPEYGPCLEVPVKLDFLYDATSTFGWFVKPPKDDAYWPCPHVAEGDAAAAAK